MLATRRPQQYGTETCLTVCFALPELCLNTLRYCPPVQEAEGQ